MSYKPQALGCFWATGWVVLPLLLLNQAYVPSRLLSEPKHHAVLLPARYAYSHSASVGHVPRVGVNPPAA